MGEGVVFFPLHCLSSFWITVFCLVYVMIFHNKDFSKISGDPCWFLFIFKEKRYELNFKEMWLVYLIAWWCFLGIFICAALISQSRIFWFQYSRRQVGHKAGPKLIYRFISLKILTKFYFCKLNKIILKFISKGISHRILNTILKKNKSKRNQST